MKYVKRLDLAKLAMKVNWQWLWNVLIPKFHGWCIMMEGAKTDETEKFMNSEVTPEVIVVDGHQYKKQMITLHNPASTRHYVFVQRYHSDWVWYDGVWTDTLKYDHKRIPKLTPDGDISYVNMSKIIVIYTLWHLRCNQ